MNNKVSQCSVKGKEYESKIYNIITKCYINNKRFNKQQYNEIGGCIYLYLMIFPYHH